MENEFVSLGRLFQCGPGTGTFVSVRVPEKFDCLITDGLVLVMEGERQNFLISERAGDVLAAEV